MTKKLEVDTIRENVMREFHDMSTEAQDAVIDTILMPGKRIDVTAEVKDEIRQWSELCRQEEEPRNLFGQASHTAINQGNDDAVTEERDEVQDT